MARIEIIEYERADGRLKEIYDDLLRRRGNLAEVHKIQSLNPETILSHINFYMSIMFSSSPLSRAQREMIAVVVSSINKCEYCQHHHGNALNHYWKDMDKVIQLRNDFTKLSLSEIDVQLCNYAVHLTNDPHSFSSSNFIDKLKILGVSDRAILDATLVIGYFNFVNRIVLALGVELETDNGKGYKY